MNKQTYHKSFVPEGCKKKTRGVPAVTVGAGANWLETYKNVTTKHKRYVQGGGCTTVGAAGGFTQGGGFGSFSKRFGTGASNILEVTLVTADGKKMIANQCQNQDLFWALKGGGGGTFGVVTSMTLKVHDLPQYFGIYKASIKAKNENGYKLLVQKFLQFFKENLLNEHWGEQFSFNNKNELNIFLMFQDVRDVEIEKTWKPLQDWLTAHPEDYEVSKTIIDIPPEKMWDPKFWQKNHPKMIISNTKKGANGEFWWAPNSPEVYRYWYTYQSWWVPKNLLNGDGMNELSRLVFQASRLAPVAFHINKGMLGASEDARKRVEETAMNPAVLDAAALIIMAAGDNEVYPGVTGKEPNLEKGRKAKDDITTAMTYFMRAAPSAGTYVNEADYFLKDWQKAFWGDNYQRLFEIKMQYDPNGLFYCHHCVGSETWTPGGLCKADETTAMTFFGRIRKRLFG